METINHNDRILGGLYGLLVGDAVGVSYEFRTPEELPAPEKINMIPHKGWIRSYQQVPPGTWSDDGAQALCLLASLVENHPEWNLQDFALRLLAWYERGYMAVDHFVFDIGIQTGQALDNLQRGKSPVMSGLRSERNNGNGSLMRCLPLVLCHSGDPLELVLRAHEQSCITHRHYRSQVCCALYCLWALGERDATPLPWESAVQTLREIYGEDNAYRLELDNVILPAMQKPPNGGGYVVDCLCSALAACRETDYPSIVRAAVSFGNDTDTTACVAGGIAGLRFGRGGIPADWIDRLRGRPEVDHLAKQLSGIISPQKVSQS